MDFGALDWSVRPSPSFHGRGEHQQQHDRREREQGGAAGQPAAPALPECAVAERRALVAADAQTLDPVAAQPQQGGEQRHRGEDGDDHDDGRGLAEHGDEADARDGEAEQGDDDGAAGERDRGPEVEAAWPIASAAAHARRGGPTARG